MRNNSSDETIKRNYIMKYLHLIKEYEQVKSKKHEHFRYVQDFYKFYDTDRRAFLKYYNRYKQSGKHDSLLPLKRGPKYASRTPLAYIENKVLELRRKGCNRYDIHFLLSEKLKKYTPSPSGIYNICKRHGLNRLKPEHKANRRRIIKEKAGELAHIDTHTLSKCQIKGETKARHLLCVVDSCTRIAWVESIPDKKALTVMFAVFRSFNNIAQRYNIRFAEVLTDNGPEFGPKESESKMDHPFERFLIEMGIKHRYTRPYRPQTNGKAERFWRSIEEDLLHEYVFESVEELEDELLKYVIYYNELRPHQGINGKTPQQLNDICPRIT